MTTRRTGKRTPPEETIEELYDQAPVGYLTTMLDGTVLRVNRTLLQWTGFEQKELIGRKWSDVLVTRAGRILLDSHVEPSLLLQGSASEIALDFNMCGARRLPVLLYISKKERGGAKFYRITVVSVTARRTYERELLAAKQAAEDSAQALRDLNADLQRRLAEAKAALLSASEELVALKTLRRERNH